MTDGSKTETKTSSYRQSGWLEEETGIVHIYYGTDQPLVPGFQKIWDNLVTENITIIPYVQPVPAV